MLRPSRTQVVLSVALVAVAAGFSGCGGGDDAEDEARPATDPPGHTTQTTPPETLATRPQTTGRAPKRDELAGTWAVAGERLLWRFGAEGTVVFDRIDLDNPFARGTWTLSGKALSLKFLGPGCVDESRWVLGMVAETNPLDDELDVVFVEEGCGRIAGTRWTLVRLAS